VTLERPTSHGGLSSPAGFFPVPRLGALKGEAEGSMHDLCNLTGHVTWKTRDNYMVLRKVQFVLLRKIGERKHDFKARR